MPARLFVASAIAMYLAIPAAAQTLAPTIALARESSQAAIPPVLDRVIAVDLHDVAIAVALDRIGDAAGTAFTIDATDRAFLAAHVTLHARSISVRDAVASVLAGTGFRVEVPSGSGPVIVPTASFRGIASQTGSVRGTVTDAVTQERLFSAAVQVDGTSSSTLSRSDGSYLVSGVPAGTYTLSVRHLGYLASRQPITVPDGSTVVADVALRVSPVTLDQVVSTATGAQRLLELGNSISTVKADSLVGTGSITTFSDLLVARTPGVQVFVNGGLSGASPEVNIRGQNSLSLSNQPLLIVDGVRVANSYSTQAPDASSQVAGRLNDIVPDEIESIEIVRGPSAATLYGTDAANGVILIRTKRGRSGRAYWTAHTEQGTISIDDTRIPRNYYAWGTDASSGAVTQCNLLSVAAALCTQDSVTTFSPFHVRSLTPLGSGQHHGYGGSFSSGSGDVRLFVSGNYDTEDGVYKMPNRDGVLLEAQRGASLSSTELRPNGYTKTGGRMTLNSPLGRGAEISLSAAYLTNESRIPAAGFLSSGYAGPGYRGTNDGWLYGNRPGNSFAEDQGATADHFTTGINAQWRPWTWLSGRANVGLDYTNDGYQALLRRGEGYVGSTGFRLNSRETTALYTVDLGTTATASVFSWLESRTSAGFQYNRRNDLVTQASSTDLQPGAGSLSGANNNGGAEATNRSVVTGGYGEETLAIRDRLFFTGAIRADAGSNFGAASGTTLYPKASVSYLLSDEAFWPQSSIVPTVRIRAAFGESGVQPLATAALARETYVGGVVHDTIGLGITLAGLGNPTLKPERQRELEAGVDVDLVAHRVRVEATYYNKRSQDAIVIVPIGPSVGGASSFVTENVGSVSNIGYEVLISADVVKGTSASWTVALSGSVNHNKLVSLAHGIQPSYGGFGYPGNVVGYPVFALYDLPITSARDANHDGIFEPGEIVVGATPRFAGDAFPKTQLTATSTAGFLANRLKVSAQLDYRGGFAEVDMNTAGRCAGNYCRGTESPKATVQEQAAAVAFTNDNTLWGYINDASFARLREVSLSYELPFRLGGGTASVAVAGRNLAIWTRYKGIDPEVTSSAGGRGQGAFQDNGGLPIARYWLARLNVAF